MTDKMREAFEHHVATKTLLSLEKYASGSYKYSSTQQAWETWQSAQAQQAAEDHVISIAVAYESGIGHCNDNLCNPYKVGSAESFAYDYGKEFGKARGIEQSVPVVGEPVAYLHADKDGKVLWSESCVCEDAVWPHIDDDDTDQSLPVYRQPTHSITTAELERLRKCEKDAERWRAALVISQAALCLPDTREPRVNSMLNAYRRAVNTGVDMTGAVDAAIAAEGEKE